MTKLPVLRLQPSRHKRVQGGHPWVFSNELVMDGAAKALEAGVLARFFAHDGSALGMGTFNSHSLIAGRILSRKPLDEIDADWFAARFKAAAARRDALIGVPYYRLIHAEADGIAGLVIDRFDRHISVQLNSAGMERLWPFIEHALESVFEPESIILHNESPVRALEGLPRETRLAKGQKHERVKVIENGLTFFTDIQGGQKTGWYFDQRDNHALVARFAKGRSVLDLYTHAGGFALCAAQAGAACVIGVDSSAPALALAAEAAAHNKLDSLCKWERADVFDDLEKRIAAKEAYGIVIADPPPFVKSRKDINAGARGYRKLATMAASVTARGGLLYIASCSYNMDLPTFTAEVARGLHEAKREGQILFTTFAAPDHPVHPNVPESSYLKGLLIRLD
ncbi:MAG: class I SAM-dependent rRNA methyltransferase [Alphaproteobacteria bacterium]|nr:class I SAM-dependent rRNA methyltransferase [Alphaproteobacteria bacterium]